MFLWCVRDGWRDIYTERGLLFPISSSRSQGVPTLAPPCKLVSGISARLRVPRPTVILCTLSKSDCVVLIIGSPSGYTPVRPECSDRAVQFTNQNVTACQRTRGHAERTEKPCHILYNNLTKLLLYHTRVPNLTVFQFPKQTYSKTWIYFVYTWSSCVELTDPSSWLGCTRLNFPIWFTFPLKDFS